MPLESNKLQLTWRHRLTAPRIAARLSAACSADSILRFGQRTGLVAVSVLAISLPFLLLAIVVLLVGEQGAVAVMTVAKIAVREELSLQLVGGRSALPALGQVDPVRRMEATLENLLKAHEMSVKVT